MSELELDTQGFRFLSISRLNTLQAHASGVRLDNTIPSGYKDPSSIVSQAMASDVKSLAKLSKAEREAGFTALTKVAVQTKQSFGFFPDSLIAKLANNQPDNLTKVQAFAVLDNPKSHLGLIDQAMGDSLGQLKPFTASDLKVSSHAAAVLYKKASEDSFFSPRAEIAGDALYKGSYALSEPYYISKLALECNNNFLLAAADLTAKTNSAATATELLTHANGLRDMEDEAVQIARQALIGTVVNFGRISDIENLAKKVPDNNTNELMIRALLNQAKESKYDLRLESYLSNTRLPIEQKLTQDVHASLLRSSSSMDVLPSQRALLKLTQKNQSSEKYDESLLTRTIDETSRKYEVYKQNNLDKTLIDIASPAVTLLDQEANTSEVEIAGMYNEQSLKEVLENTFGEDKELLFDIKFKGAATPLIKQIISKQISKSIAGEPNDLDRLMQEPVKDVVSKLDSRQSIQDRILNDAAISNKENLAQKRELELPSVTAEGKLDNSVTRSQTHLMVEVEGHDKKTYRASDYESFDALAVKLHSDLDKYAKGETPKITAGHLSRSSYLSKTLDKDLAAYVDKPGSETIYRLNQHWTLSAEQLIDNRVDSRHDRLEIKNALNNNERKTQGQTNRGKASP